MKKKHPKLSKPCHCCSGLDYSVCCQKYHQGIQEMGRDASFTERSRFRKIDGKWLYHSGTFLS